jgi:hypothetical protein
MIKKIKIWLASVGTELGMRLLKPKNIASSWARFRLKRVFVWFLQSPFVSVPICRHDDLLLCSLLYLWKQRQQGSLIYCVNKVQYFTQLSLKTRGVAQSSRQGCQISVGT